MAPQAIIDIVNKIKSSSRQDEISTKLMKAAITHIINPITRIINQALQTVLVPDKMKVLLIFKSSNQSLLKTIDQLAYCQQGLVRHCTCLSKKSRHSGFSPLKKRPELGTWQVYVLLFQGRTASNTGDYICIK